MAELFRIEQAGGDTAFTATSYTDMNGYVGPLVTYTGKPIRLVLDIQSVQNDNANALTSFRILDDSNVEVATLAIDQLATGRPRSGRREVVIPKAGVYEMAVGATRTFKVQSKVSAGTSTLHALFNDATTGSTPEVFMAETIEGTTV